MIINVKSTRSEPEQQASHPYAFGDEPKASRWPLALAALMTGFVLYLKSMFPGWGEAEARPDEGPRQDDGQPEKAMRLVASREGAAPDENAAEAAEGDKPPEDDPVVGSGGRLFGLTPAAWFTTIHGSEMDFPEVASFGPVSSGPFQFAGVYMAANDNAAPGGTDSGDTGSGGGPGTGPGGPDGPDPGADPDDPGDDDERANRAPRVNGPVYLADVAGCAIALVGLSDLLTNAVDPDGDALSVRNITVSSGTLTAAQGGWLFDAAGYGIVTLTYRITDGALSVMQTAYLKVVRNTVPGTPAADLLVGTECGDDIDGGDGDDNIDARGGDDTIVGGSGNDHIVAGAGADTVLAGLGHDIVIGGDGDDWISGGAGNDRLFGEAGNDMLFGDEGDDRLWGGVGDDMLYGGADNDALQGNEGSDRLLGGDGGDDLAGGAGGDVVMGEAGDDSLNGDDGNDVLSGGEGVDHVHGGAGDDLVLGDLDAVGDRYEGGAGIDLLSYASARQAVSVDLAAGTAQGSEIGLDLISSFESVETGAGNDTVVGSAANERISGNDGCDLLAGGAGEDHVLAGAGDDRVIGDLDGAKDAYDGGAGTDTIDYSAATAGLVFDLTTGKVTGVQVGEDTISNFEVYVGGKGDDHFMANGHGGTLRGGGGSDVFEFAALSAAGTRVAYEILDFMAGDRVRVSRFEIFEEVIDSLEDRFEDIYGDDIDDDDLPILISHQQTGDIRSTLIEADLDNDDHYELAITLHGTSQVTVVETA